MMRTLILMAIILLGCGTATKTPVDTAYWKGFRQGQADAKQGFLRSHCLVENNPQAHAYWKGYQAGNSAGFKKKHKRRKRNN